MRKLELLAPAGDMEKLKMAVLYGADAVYFGGEAFSLRSGAGNFSVPQIREGVSYAHRFHVRCYLTLNIYARNRDIEPIRSFLREIRDIPMDGFLVADPGVMELLKEEIPDAVIHLSTQANLTNYEAARFWRKIGVKRLVLARELTIEEIRGIRGHIPPDMELECFVHGAMCISYSGRCLLSSFMTGRDSNQGMCAHPCRYHYALEEEKRPGQYVPIEEDERGSYILNSKDLCMIRHIPELADAGVYSLKIEGRNKSIFYLATVVHAYRQALDAYLKDPEHWTFREEWFQELEKASHREFYTGFYFGYEGADAQNYKTSAYEKPYQFVGKVLAWNEKDNTALIEERNKLVKGDEVEIFGPEISYFMMTVDHIQDEETGEEISEACHPKQKIRIPMPQSVKPGYLLRKKENH
ncbi:MAG: U32 family peptidase [Eubacteriales bacterium]|nr:U32 family peptidase [Eubacteriales bacterium]